MTGFSARTTLRAASGSEDSSRQYTYALSLRSGLSVSCNAHPTSQEFCQHEHITYSPVNMHAACKQLPHLTCLRVLPGAAQEAQCGHNHR